MFSGIRHAQHNYSFNSGDLKDDGYTWVMIFDIFCFNLCYSPDVCAYGTGIQFFLRATVFEKTIVKVG